MPIYEYQCIDHGLFEVARPLALFRQPASCPQCERPATRVISSVAVRTWNAGSVVSARNEQAAHAPRVVSGAGGNATACGHQHPKRPRLQPSQGPRPWVLEHG